MQDFVLFTAYHKENNISVVLMILTFFDMTFLSILTLNFLLLNTLVHSSLFLCGVSTSGCFVKKHKSGKLFIKIVISVPMSFSFIDTYTQNQALHFQLSRPKHKQTAKINKKTCIVNCYMEMLNDL